MIAINKFLTPPNYLATAIICPSPTATILRPCPMSAIWQTTAFSRLCTTTDISSMPNVWHLCPILTIRCCVPQTSAGYWTTRRCTTSTKSSQCGARWLPTPTRGGVPRPTAGETRHARACLSPKSQIVLPVEQ